MRENAITRFSGQRPLAFNVVAAIFLGVVFGLLHGIGETPPGLSVLQTMAFVAGGLLWFSENLDASYVLRHREGARGFDQVFYLFVIGWFWVAIMLVSVLSRDPALDIADIAIWLVAGIVFSSILAIMDKAPSEEALTRRAARHLFLRDRPSASRDRVFGGLYITFGVGLFALFLLWPATLDPGEAAISLLLLAGGLQLRATPAAGAERPWRICASVLGALLIFAGYALA